MSGKTYVVRRGTTGVPNSTVHDKRLSYAALGLLVTLLARPDEAPGGYRDLEGRGLGQAATLKALKELDEAGYRHRWTRAGGRRALRTDIIITECPTTDDEAQQRLAEQLGQGSLGLGIRAAESHARTDQGRGPIAAGRIARSASTHDSSGHDRAPHSPKGLQGDYRFALVTGDSKGECEHGEVRGPGYCALCRAGLPSSFGNAQVLDFKLRQAGERPDTEEES